MINPEMRDPMERTRTPERTMTPTPERAHAPPRIIFECVNGEDRAWIKLRSWEDIPRTEYVRADLYERAVEALRALIELRFRLQGCPEPECRMCKDNHLRIANAEALLREHDALTTEDASDGR